MVDPASGYCIGCGRTRAEIAAWIGLTPAERHSVMEHLPARLSSLTDRKRRRGGRAGRLAG